MRRESDDVSLLWDMFDAAQKIQQFIMGKSFHGYSRDEVLQEKLWRVATVRIPELLALLGRFLPPPPASEE